MKKLILLILLTFPLLADFKTNTPNCRLIDKNGIEVDSRSTSIVNAVAKASRKPYGKYKIHCPDITVTVYPREGEVVETPPVTEPNNFAILNWTAPTENTDNSLLTDLSGFRIYYGTNSNDLSQMIEVNSPSTVQYKIDNLAKGDHYFTVVAINALGMESDLSNIVNKRIED